jgi:hypothetical protein
MSQKDFKMIIVIDQKNSTKVLEIAKDFGIDFELQGERGFAPVSPETAVQILINMANALPTIIAFLKKIWANKGQIDFETRHRLARRMLADLGPLYEIKAEDKRDYSYYEFKTAKDFHFWELDKGEIKHGTLGRPGK